MSEVREQAYARSEQPKRTSEVSKQTSKQSKCSKVERCGAIEWNERFKRTNLASDQVAVSQVWRISIDTEGRINKLSSQIHAIKNEEEHMAFTF